MFSDLGVWPHACVRVRVQIEAVLLHSGPVSVDQLFRSSTLWPEVSCDCGCGGGSNGGWLLRVNGLTGPEAEHAHRKW